MYFMDLDDFQIVSSSPEILARVEDGVITNRPLAGTRRRGHTEEEDLAFEAELKADPKEIAEHLMLIDLGRNDVGRVAQAGSVDVTERFAIERYSHVMHLSSTVEGKLLPEKSAMDVLRATLPVGTLSGAQGAGHGDYRRVGTCQKRDLRWSRGLFGLEWKHGYCYRNSHRRD